jgi:hypothetical protein
MPGLDLRSGVRVLICIIHSLDGEDEPVSPFLFLKIT